MKITNCILRLKLLSFLVGPDSAKGEFYVNFEADSFTIFFPFGLMDKKLDWP